MVLDVDTLTSDDADTDSQRESESDEDELVLDFQKLSAKKSITTGGLHIGHLLQMILQDAQTRLVFRTQAILQAEVRY